ncbi:MAG: hypothetical protein F6J90_25915 [Moorea sp. SIOASIH]|uniref:hypothetical protein n=1 Tax=Moorena sp. SIOASIH TaxID=2607817 RepID=UPI0013B825F6|nr:hypothetical protein [Moorena sp. SIOASIH]NEO39582.1 hypothetical protein [Moorena sp. SIOASIH]
MGIGNWESGIGNRESGVGILLKLQAKRYNWLIRLLSAIKFSPSPHLPTSPSPHLPITPSPHHPISPSPHHPISLSLYRFPIPDSRFPKH